MTEGAERVWDVVHTIDEWYDGPRAGSAEYLGQPVWYRSVYLDNPNKYDHDENRFELSPLPREALDWHLELDAIFKRWDSALKERNLIWETGDEDSFGALPEEMERYRELRKKIDTILSEREPKIVARGNFDEAFRRVQWILVR